MTPQSPKKKSENIVKGEFVPIKKKKRNKKKFKDNGVKKTFCIGWVLGMPETYNNLEKILAEFNTDFFSWLIGDNKILRQGYGMQPCSSKFGCVWCHASAPYGFEENFTLRTGKSLRENFEKFEKLVEKHGFETAKRLYGPMCKSVVKRFLIALKDHEEVLDKSPPGQLHIYLGSMNKKFDEMHKRIIEDIKNGHV